MKSNGRLRVFLLMATDVACLMAVWCLTIWGYRLFVPGRHDFGDESLFYLRFWPLGLIYVLVNLLFRLYHGRAMYPAAPLSPVEELRRLVCSSFLLHLGTIAYLALAYQTTRHYSRGVIVFSGILTAMLSQPVRNLVRFVLQRFAATRIPVLVAGPPDGTAVLASAIASDSYLGFRPEVVEGAEAEALVRAGRERGVRTLILSDGFRLSREQMATLGRWYYHVACMSSESVFPIFGAQAIAFGGICGLELAHQRDMLLPRLEKWLLDRFLALVAVVMLSPFFVVVPILIKLTSRGPVFYRQARLGKKGRPIRVWKFRSMYRDADARLQRLLDTDPARRREWEANFKLEDDPRVTPLGRFLRKTSIDEFPQLLNVFAGDMTLVGPRPIVAKEVPLYGDAYETFASVKPGITGLWQASGRSDTDYARRVALDVQYVLNWSPWMDLWILFRTVGAVLFMKGAR